MGDILVAGMLPVIICRGYFFSTGGISSNVTGGRFPLLGRSCVGRYPSLGGFPCNDSLCNNEYCLETPPTVKLPFCRNLYLGNFPCAGGRICSSSALEISFAFQVLLVSWALSINWPE